MQAFPNGESADEREKDTMQEVKLSIVEWCFKGKTGAGVRDKVEHAENVIQ